MDGKKTIKKYGNVLKKTDCKIMSPYNLMPMTWLRLSCFRNFLGISKSFFLFYILERFFLFLV